MPRDPQFTLKQLAQIALGSTKVDAYNVSVLHSLMNMLLKKLDCEDETVTITGCQSNCLIKILEQSKICPIPFNDDNVQSIAEKTAKIDELENRIKKLNDKIDDHIARAKKLQHPYDKILKWSDWDEEGYPIEDFCTVCDDANTKIACDLLDNRDFLKKLCHRLATPMIERMFELEEKILDLDEEQKVFIQKLHVMIEKIEVLGVCIDHLEDLRTQVENNYVKQIAAMEEVQEILDNKMNKYHIPALKKYIQDRLSSLEKMIMDMQAKEDCPKAAGIIMNVKCVSCKGEGRGMEVGLHNVPVMPDALLKKKQKPFDTVLCKPCTKWKETAADVTQQVFSMDDDPVYQFKSAIKASLGKCTQSYKSPSFIKGNNGFLYQKG